MWNKVEFILESKKIVIIAGGTLENQKYKNDKKWLFYMIRGKEWLRNKGKQECSWAHKATQINKITSFHLDHMTQPLQGLQGHWSRVCTCVMRNMPLVPRAAQLRDHVTHKSEEKRGSWLACLSGDLSQINLLIGGGKKKAGVCVRRESGFVQEWLHTAGL